MSETITRYFIIREIYMKLHNWDLSLRFYSIDYKGANTFPFRLLQ